MGSYFRFPAQVYAQSSGSEDQMVAILVDTAIYDTIQGDLQRYTQSYIPQQSPGTKPLIIPIDGSSFHAKDIQHMLENLYFEGMQDQGSRLVGVVLFGELPMPIVELEQKRFSSVYPYVDFDDPMFVYNPGADIFQYNDYPDSLPELRHAAIPTNDVGLFSTFFAKLKEYAAAPTDYAQPKIWIEDFTFMKQAFAEEELDHYINQMLFSQAESYRRPTTVFNKILKGEFEEDVQQKIEKTKNNMDERAGQLGGHEAFEGDAEVQQASDLLISQANSVIDKVSPEKIQAAIQDGSDLPLPTLVLEKLMAEEFADNQVVFGNRFLSELKDNMLAGGRYQLRDIDLSSEKIAIRDEVARQYLEDINTILEQTVDDALYEESYFMKYPLSYLYIERKPRDAGTCAIRGEKRGFGNAETSVVTHRYENFYFGRNAVDVLLYPELHPYRGSWFNAIDAQATLDGPLLPRGKESIEDRPGFDPNSISVGASYGRLAQQVEQNRAYNYNETLEDKGIYDDRKCEKDQPLDEFSLLFWGGASSLNLDVDKIQQFPKYPETKEKTTKLNFSRHPMLDRRIGGPWFDVAGGILLQEEIDVARLDRYAHHDYGHLLEVNNPLLTYCEPRYELDQIPEKTSFEEVDFFDDTGEFFDGWGVFKNQISDGGYPGYNGLKERVVIRVHGPDGGLRDRDDDGILNHADDDLDGDGIPNAQDADMDGDMLPNGSKYLLDSPDIDNDNIPNDADPDVDGDGIPNEDDEDINGLSKKEVGSYPDYDIDDDGPLYRNGNDDRRDPDMDKDGILNVNDPDMNQNQVPNGSDPNMDSDRSYMYKHHEIMNAVDKDIDGDGVLNWHDFMDLDGDGIPNQSDPDTDADGIPNEDDEDIDADRELNRRDKSACGGGSCNGSAAIQDTDADGTLDVNDDDQDGDGIPNDQDSDQDGDGLGNEEDLDVDADNILNSLDPDADNDGIPNADDPSPWGFGTYAEQDVAVSIRGRTNTVYAANDCNGDDPDVDGDGIPNHADNDVDGDGIPNHADNDVDGDGIFNGDDPDVDCDGTPNGKDSDTDGDGVVNGGDSDCDGDGIANGDDPDIDGDGIANGDDPDIDGDGIPNAIDYEDIDGDGLANTDDEDMDGDGIPNTDDEDMDGDGVVNQVPDAPGLSDSDSNGSGTPDTQEQDIDADGIPNDEDETPRGKTSPLQYGEIIRNPNPQGCFDLERQYRYQLIDTVTKHDAPRNDELDQMHPMTFERPIDDARYVHFLGIGGDLVKFIYPDMYHVDVFEGGTLLEKEQIEQKIRQYLKDKVQIFNQYLDEQLQKSPDWYQLHPEAYDFLATVDPAASPLREYALFGENDFVDAVGDKNIQRLAEALYHLNVTWKEQRPQGSSLGAYIEDARETFDLNKKIELVMDDYLQYDDPSDDFKFDPIAFPTHIDKKYAYEVGVISSDGDDSLKVSDVEERSIYERMHDDEVPTSGPTTPTFATNNTSPQADKLATKNAEDDMLCNIPPSGEVALLKRPKAVKCRWEKTIERPVDFSFELAVERDTLEDVVDAAKGDTSGGRGEWIDESKNVLDSVGGTDESENVLPDIRAFSDEDSNLYSVERDYSSDRSIGDVLVSKVYASTVESSLVDEANQLQQQLSRVSINVSDSITTVDTEEPIELYIKSRQDVGEVRVTLSTDGKVCPILASTNLCAKSFVARINPYADPTTLFLGFADTAAGSVDIDAEICIGSVCTTQVVHIFRTAESLEHIIFQTVNDTVPAGGLLPFSISGRDKYNNKVDILDVPYVLSLSAGSLVERDDTRSLSLLSLRDTYYTIHADELTAGDQIVVTLAPDPAYGTALAAVLPTQTYTIDVVDADLSLKDNEGMGLDDMLYTLPSQAAGLYKYTDEQLVLRDDLPQIQIAILASGNQMQLPITVRAEKGLVGIGDAASANTQHDFTQEVVFVGDTESSIELTLLPTGKAGDDTLLVEGLGLAPIRVPITIQPSSPAVLDIDVPAGTARPGDILTGTVKVFDDRGNKYTLPATIDLESTGGWEIAPMYEHFVIHSGGVAEFTGKVTTGGSCGAAGSCSGGGESGVGDGNTGPGDGTGAEDSSGDSDENGNNNEDQTGNEEDKDEDAADQKDKEDKDGANDADEDDKDSIEGAIHTQIDFTTERITRPSDAQEDDLNIMYLNLFSKARGNEANTVQMLNNTKTLAITTQFDAAASVQAQPIVKMLMKADATISNPGSVAAEVVPQGGDIKLLLGHEGGVGEVLLGNWDAFSYVQDAVAYNTGDRGTITYTPLGNTKEHASSFAQAQISLDDEVMVDFVRGYMNPEVFIRFQSGQTRDVTYKNQIIGRLRIQRDTTHLPDALIRHGSYITDRMPFGSSSNDEDALAILLQDEIQSPGKVTLFDSIQKATDPAAHIGYRANFANVTNFAQGMTVGAATKSFGGPFVLNIGDAFLKRVQKNRTVKATIYDDGVGKVLFADTARIADTDFIDFDKDDKQDMLVTYKDGSVRILKNYGGEDPFADLGTLLVVADGAKEIYVGDVDGDGREDIMLLTMSEKLRVYYNHQGVFDVQGMPVCIDIPLGHKNVAQAKQIFAEDINDDKMLDIITNDINGDIKVFYGGGSAEGSSYVSRDPMKCDDDRKSRQKMETVKSFGTTLGGPIPGEGLRYRPGLEVEEPVPEEQQYTDEDTDAVCPDGSSRPSSAKKDFNKKIIGQMRAGNMAGANCAFTEKMTKEEMKRYAKTMMQQAMQPAREMDPRAELDKALQKENYATLIPDVLKPTPYKQTALAGVRAYDPNQMTPRFDVSKQFRDLNGGTLQKGDIVRVDVSLIPIGGSIGPVMYREKITGPWIVYTDEYGKIETFDPGNLANTPIDRNIGQGYDFVLYDLTLEGTATFSYELQFNGNGYVNIEVETLEKDLYKGPTRSSVSSLFSSDAYAQGGWSKRIRTYPDDGCYKKYWTFSPGEEEVDLTSYLQEKEETYEDHFDTEREEIFTNLEENYNLMGLKEQMGIVDSLEERKLKDRLEDIMQSVSQNYLPYFVDISEQGINTASMGNLSPDAVVGMVDKIGLWDDYEFGYEKCGGITFGKKMCGQGIPLPFNMAFLSPGTYNVMGCKLKDDKGVPVFAFPAAGALPIWPINPSRVGGVFGGNTSQFRIYISPTLTAGLGVAMCFGPNKAGMKIKSPPGDLVGNCLVIAGNIGTQCVDGKSPVKDVPNNKQQESVATIEPQQRDLDKIGTCHQQDTNNSPFVSDVLGDKVVVLGKKTRAQASTAALADGSSTYQTAPGHGDESISLDINGQDLLLFEKEELVGGTPVDLKVEGGSIKGLRQCLIQNWLEKQEAYFANNALSMNMQVILPKIGQLGANIDTLVGADNINQTYQFDGDETTQRIKDAESSGTADKRPDDPQQHSAKQFLPAAIHDVMDNQKNIFSQMAMFFEDIPLINIEYQTSYIEIPFIYKNERVRYAAYLDTWIKRNEATLKAWKSANNASIDGLSGAREGIDGLQEAKNRDEVIEQMDKILINAKTNQKTIERYGTFKDDLAEWTHMSDQYTKEIVSFVEIFTSEVTGRLQDNAQRFSKWVDTVVLVIGIVKTWQTLIDLSVNRNNKCAKCKQDNYDFYSCKLSMLCVDLPILPIPSFHLPDILIDLSNIYLGVDIILPEIELVPRQVKLPPLPDFPAPYDIEIDVELPVLPLLPLPPDLPDLPEMDLDVDIALPTLPPAPKIPKLSPAIKVVVELLDLVGTFWCIFKMDVGLVAEQGVKTRIEQMTQRKQDIMPFDDMKISFDPSPVPGVDYKLTSYVDIKADFSLLYDAVDEVTSRWNREVNAPLKKGERFLKEDVLAVPRRVSDGLGDIEDNINVDLNPFGVQDRGADDPLVRQRAQQKIQKYIGGSYEDVFASLDSGLHYLAEHEALGWMRDDVAAIRRLISMPTQVAPNIQQIEAIRDAVTTDMQDVREDNRELREHLEDIDTYLESLDGYSLVADTAQKSHTYVAPLFTVDDYLYATIKKQPHPTTSMINMQRGMVDGYLRALEKHPYYDLNMTALEHENLTYYFADLQDRLTKVPTRLATSDEHLASTSPMRLAQTSGAGGGGGSSASGIEKVDFTQYIEGFFVPGKDDDYHNVIAWIEQGEKMYHENTFHIADINGDDKQDIILYDEHVVRVKYGDQQDTQPGGGSTQSVTLGPFSSPQDLIAQVEATNGWYTAADGNYKLWDKERVHYGFARQGHNLDAMSWNREQDPTIDAYVMEVAEKVDTHHEKTRGGPGKIDPRRTRYIVVLPESMTYEGLAISLPDQLEKKSIAGYLEDGTVVDVLHYNAQKNTVKAMLRDVDKKRYYAKVASLRLYKQTTEKKSWWKRIFGNAKEGYDYYLERVGPWSRQSLAGAQAWADDQAPKLQTQLTRDVTGEIVAEGQYLLGNINTSYTLDGIWTDDGEVVENRVIRSGETIATSSGETIVLDNLDYKQPIEDVFTFVAVDQAGNIARERVLLNINVPDLTIEDIDYKGIGADVTSLLSDTIDRGQIKFERNRLGYWEDLQPAYYPVQPTNPRVTGGLYSFDTSIEIVDTSGKQVCSINTETGKIQGDNIDVQGSFAPQGWAHIQIKTREGSSDGDSGTGNNKKQKKDIFDVYMKSAGLTGDGVTLLDPRYEILPLYTNFLPGFKEGYCVRPANDACHIYLTSVGDIYIPPRYMYDYTATYTAEQYASYTLHKDAQTIMRVDFIPKSFK